MIGQILIWWVINGAVYVMLALGFTLMFGAARVINLAQGSFFMASAYLVYIFTSLLQLNIPLSVVLTVILAGAIGVIVYQLCIKRIEEHHGAVLLITLAIALILEEIFLLIFSGYYRSLEPFIPGSLALFGIDILNQCLLTLGVVLVCLVSTGVFLYKTKMGLAVRCVAQDREIANVMGINVGRIYLITMAFGAALVGIAGAMIAPIYTLSPEMGWHPLIMMLAVVVLGGLGSIRGSIIGAFIIAFAEVMVIFLLPMGSFIKGAVALAIVIAVLLLKPEGLFGVVFEEERL